MSDELRNKYKKYFFVVSLEVAEVNSEMEDVWFVRAVEKPDLDLRTWSYRTAHRSKSVFKALKSFFYLFDRERGL